LLLPAVLLAQPGSYTISTIAGTGGTAYSTTAGSSGDGASATNAFLNAPISVAVDSSHNIYIADSNNNKIRKIAGGIITTLAGKTNAGFSGDGGPAVNALFNSPYALYFDNSGNLFIADLLNQVVREILAAGGTIQTVAGNNTNGYYGDNGVATNAELSNPFGVAVDSAGRIYISDSNNNRVRVVNPATGIITTYAGNGYNLYGGDNGPAVNASVNRPEGLAVDAAGDLYIADNGNNRIRRVAANGTITTVAGTGTAGSTGDGGPATKALLSHPWGVALDSSGDLFIADYGNSRIREITPDGIIHTIAGGTGVGYTGDGYIATNAKLNFPTGVAVDSSTGKVYIADSSNNVIRMLTPYPPVVSGVQSAGQFGAFPAVAPGSWIEVYGSNLAIDSRPWTGGDFVGLAAPTSLDGTTVTIGGQTAYIDYIGGGQVNVQVPSNVPTGQQPLIVTTAYGTSAAYTVTVNATQPGLYAPSWALVNGTQYLGAESASFATFVLPPGAVSGIPSQRAKAGDTIVLWGIGFGSVNGDVSAGQIVQAQNTLALPLQVFIGGTQAKVTYDGLAPGSVGLYQFDVVVPAVASSDAVPVTFTLGGTPGTQTAFIAVQ
jgi:uncharacterized protein (TIGR03437 family)